MSKRIGIVGIILENPGKDAMTINKILGEYSSIIVGRMGIPHRTKGVSVIALTVDGSNEEIGAMTGKIGQLKLVTVRSTLVPLREGEKQNEK